MASISANVTRVVIHTVTLILHYATAPLDVNGTQSSVVLEISLQNILAKLTTLVASAWKKIILGLVITVGVPALINILSPLFTVLGNLFTEYLRVNWSFWKNIKEEDLGASSKQVTDLAKQVTDLTKQVTDLAKQNTGTEIQIEYLAKQNTNMEIRIKDLETTCNSRMADLMTKHANEVSDLMRQLAESKLEVEKLKKELNEQRMNILLDTPYSKKNPNLALVDRMEDPPV